MLVLSRKNGQKLIIDDKIEIVIIESSYNAVKLGIVAPKDVTVLREEIYQEIIKNNNGDIVNNKSYCNEYSIYGNVLYNKDKSSYIIENITYCKNYDISKYREINATLFEKNENTINEITSYEYKEESSILLDKFLGGKTFKGDYSKGICEKYKKDNLYLEVKVVTFDNKIDLINIPLVMEGKCK